MKYFLFFSQDNDNQEDCNVYYSSLVEAKNKEEAIDKYCQHAGISRTEYEEMDDCIQMKVIR